MLIKNYNYTVIVRKLKLSLFDYLLVSTEALSFTTSPNTTTLDSLRLYPLC